MTIPSNRIVHLTVAACAAFTVISVAATALFPAGASIVSYGTVQRRAIRDRDEQHQNLLEYYRALEIFHKRITNGETDLVRPDPNDPASVRSYIDGSAKEELPHHASSEEESVEPVRSLEDLSKPDRDILDRYRRAGKCSEALKSGAPGLFELCERLVKESRTDLQHQRKINRLIDAGSRRGASRSRNYKLDLLERVR